MLKGMNVAANALEAESKQSIDIVYEDRDLAVIVKPSGMLTVPGRSKKQSVETILRQRWNDNDTPIIVHRLDMQPADCLLWHEIGMHTSNCKHSLRNEQYRNAM